MTASTMRRRERGLVAVRVDKGFGRVCLRVEDGARAMFARQSVEKGGCVRVWVRRGDGKGV